jgi:hypothetical protein
VYSRVYPPNNVPILLQFWFPCMHGSISSTTAYTNHSTCDRYLRKYQGTIGRYKTTKFESEILQPADGERNPHCLFIYLRLSICVDLAKVYNVERVTPKLRTVQSSRLSPMSPLSNPVSHSYYADRTKEMKKPIAICATCCSCKAPTHTPPARLYVRTRLLYRRPARAINRALVALADAIWRKSGAKKTPRDLNRLIQKRERSRHRTLARNYENMLRMNVIDVCATNERYCHY